MRALMWVNLAWPTLVVAGLVAVFLQAGGASFAPAQLSDPAAFSSWTGAFVQLSNAVLPLAALLVAHLASFRAARDGDARSRRKARAWCLGAIAGVALCALQAGAMGAFARLSVPETTACLTAFAAIVAGCGLDWVVFRRTARRELAPTPGFEPGTR